MSELARGSFMRINNGENLNKDSMYLQILDITKMPNGRYKLKLNDQENWMMALAQQNRNSVFMNEEAIAGSVIELTDHIINNVNGQKMMIMKEWTILQKDCEILGNPAPIPAAQPAQSKPSGFGSSGGFGGSKPAGFGGQTRSNNPFGGASSTGGGGGDDSEFQPVTQLSPFQKAFKIKVRVTRKGPIKTWNNSRGSGKLFSVDLLDHHGGEIQATMFNDAVDKFYVIFEEGKVFTISKGRVKIANKRYTHITNDYQLDLNEHSEVTLVGDDTSIRAQVYDFKTLDQCADLEGNSYVDAIGVCDNVGEIQNFTSQRTQKELTKRSFRIADQTGTAIECTLWGNEAQNLDPNSILNQVVAVKAARVSDFNGKSLSVNGVDVNPAGCPETAVLQKWWTTGGSDAKINSLTQTRGGGGRDAPPITLAEVEKNRLGTTAEKPDYFNVIGTVMQIPVDMEKRQPWYNAVPDTDIPAYKVIEDPNGGEGWYCEKNGKNYTDYLPRYILRCKIADGTSTEWLNMYNDEAVKILGHEAKELESMYNNKEESRFNQVFKDAQHKTWNFRCRAKQQEYQGEMTRRIDAVGATEINYVDDSLRMCQLIETLMS